MQLQILMIVVLIACTSGDSNVPSDHFLHKSLRQFDTIHKDDISHEVLYQGYSGNHLRLVKFNSLGRNFHLHLTPHQGLFADDFVAYHVDCHGNMTLYEVDKNRFYSGHVLGETQSSVVVHVSDLGVLTGTVATDTEVYYIEPSQKFINVPHDYHMITYRHSDVNFEISNTSLDYQHAPPVITDGKQLMGKVVQDSVTGRHGSGRLRRALRGNTCQMYLVADTHYFNNVGSNSIGDSIITMVSIIASVDRDTYRNTLYEFSNGSNITGLGLQVAAAMVHTEFNDDLERFPYNRNDGADIDEVLNRFSTLPSTDPPQNEPQQNRFCLAHLFTFRSFSQNRLGLANIASSAPGTTGGICSNTVRFSGSRRVYNTGVSTFIIGERLLMRVESQLVVAHEIGHNWGSMHDSNDDDACNDNYLMDAFAQTGDNPNNFRFSPCSRTMIADALSNKGNCFSNDPQTKCGNFVVEEGEECDAGLNRNDRCCNDQCELKTQVEAVCSDVNSDCCTNCSASSVDTLCHTVTNLNISTDCTDNTYCNGRNFTCPQLETLDPGTPCIFGQCTDVNNNGTTICTSLCAANGTMPCSCQGADACRVCCMINETCMPLEFATNASSNGIASDGVPCISDGVTGVCSDGVCMSDPQEDGTVRRFLRFIQNLSGDAVVRAIEENIVGFILICTLLVWVPVSLLIHFLVDRKVYKRFLKYIHDDDDEKEKITSMSRKRRPRGPSLELHPLLDQPAASNRPSSTFFDGNYKQIEE